jgi:hypothetical protein
MFNSRGPSTKFDTPENLAARGKALAIWNSAPVEQIPFNKVIEMVYYAEESAKGSSAEHQLRAERKIMESVRSSHAPDTLREFRALFRSRAFDGSIVLEWLNSRANLLEMTDQALVEGYPELLVSATPSGLRCVASMLETLRRQSIDKNPDAGSFASLYSDRGK